MTFTAEVPEGAAYRVNRKNLGAGGRAAATQSLKSLSPPPMARRGRCTPSRCTAAKRRRPPAAPAQAAALVGAGAPPSPRGTETATPPPAAAPKPRRKGNPQRKPSPWPAQLGRAPAPAAGKVTPLRRGAPLGDWCSKMGRPPGCLPLRALGQDAGQALPPKGGAHREITAKKRRCPFGQRLFCQEFFCWARRRRCCTRTSLPKNSSLP